MSVDAVGSAGGIIILWECRFINVLSKWKDVFSVSILVEDLKIKSQWLLMNVYGPTDQGQKGRLLEGIRCSKE